MKDKILGPLSSIAEVISGFAFKSTWFGSGIDKVVRISDFDKGRVALTNAVSFDAQKHPVSSKYKICSGDILVALSGATVGKVGVASPEEAGAYLNQRVAIVRGHNPDNTCYLSFLLRSNYMQQLLPSAEGAAQPNLSPKLLESLPIPIPSVDNQRRIAAHLKSQLTTIEEARTATKIQLEDSRKLISAILKATFAEIADANMVKISDVAQTSSGSTPSRDHKEYWEPAEFPWVKTGEVVFEPIRNTSEKVSLKALKECSLPLLPKGTVLLAMYGQGKTRGQSAVLEIEATTNQACFAIFPNATFDSEYLQFWLRHSYEDLRTLSDSRGGNQSNLNGSILNQFEVPLVSSEKQQSIVKHIKEAVAEAQILQNGLQQQLKEIELLPGKILAKAFEIAA